MSGITKTQLLTHIGALEERQDALCGALLALLQEVDAGGSGRQAREHARKLLEAMRVIVNTERHFLDR
jgi:hypothetical protein